MLDSRRVLLFRAVARGGSLSAAARSLRMTQPAVSQQLRQLELQVGAPLLIRSTRGVTLTEAGRALLNRADTIASELRLGAEELASLTQIRGGHVRLAAFPTAAATIVPPVLESMHRRYPDLRVSLIEAEPEDSRAALREGTADCAIVFAYNGPPAETSDLVWIPLLIESMHLITTPGLLDGTSPDGRLSFFESASWIAGCVHCRVHLVDSCRAAGVEPRLTHESDDYVVAQNLVARGMGVTVLPSMALRAFTHPQVQSVAEPMFGERFIGLSYRPGAQYVPAIGALLEAIAAQSRQE